MGELARRACREEGIPGRGAACTKPWGLNGELRSRGVWAVAGHSPQPPACPVLVTGSHHPWNGSRQGASWRKLWPGRSGGWRWETLATPEAGLWGAGDLDLGICGSVSMEGRKWALADMGVLHPSPQTTWLSLLVSCTHSPLSMCFAPKVSTVALSRWGALMPQEPKPTENLEWPLANDWRCRTAAPLFGVSTLRLTFTPQSACGIRLRSRPAGRQSPFPGSSPLHSFMYQLYPNPISGLLQRQLGQALELGCPVQIPALPFTTCETLSKWLRLSEPPFSSPIKWALEGDSSRPLGIVS